MVVIFCINSTYSLRTKDKVNSSENMWKNLEYCYVEMPKK